MVEKWELTELELDLKFNLPLDLNTQYFYAFQKYKYKSLADPGLWKRDLNVETEQVLFNTDGVKIADSSKNVLDGMGIDLTPPERRNLRNLSAKHNKLKDSLRKELLDKGRVLTTDEDVVAQDASLLDNRSSLDYAMQKRFDRIYNSEHILNHRIFDSFNRFFVDSSFPMYAKTQAKIEDEVHTKPNKNYKEPEPQTRRNRVLEEAKKNERILLGDHEHEEEAEDTENSDAYKLAPVDKSMYTKNKIIRGLIEVGTFGETAICRCPDGSMYYAGKYDWTFFPELYACEGGVIEGYHRFTDFEGQGIKIICGHEKIQQETCENFQMASCECGEVTYNNSLNEEKTKKLYCPKHYTCQREETTDENDVKTIAKSGQCVKKFGDSGLEDKYKSRWKFHDHDGKTTIHMHKFDEIEGVAKFENDDNGMEKTKGPHVHVPEETSENENAEDNHAHSDANEKYELPRVCANACEFVRLDEQKCGREVDTDYYCKNDNQECIRDQIQVIMWGRENLPILMDKFNIREANNKLKNDVIVEIEDLESQVEEIEGAGKVLPEITAKLTEIETGANDDGLTVLRDSYAGLTGVEKTANRREQIKLLEKYVKIQFLHCRHGNSRLQLIKQIRAKSEELMDKKILTQDGTEKPVLQIAEANVNWDADGGWLDSLFKGENVKNSDDTDATYTDSDEAVITRAKQSVEFSRIIQDDLYKKVTFNADLRIKTLTAGPTSMLNLINDETLSLKDSIDGDLTAALDTK